MNPDDSIAEKFQQYDGQALADYLPVALPCYLLQVDAVVIERKKLMPVEEFLLRAVDAGLPTKGDAGALLGLSERHAEQLVCQLEDEEYLSVGDDGTVRIRPKGKQVLTMECEKRPAERSVSVVWDPVREAPLTSWFDLLSPSDVRAEDRLVVVPRSLRLPNPSAIPIDEIQAARRRGGFPDRENADEIVRFLEIQRKTLRYRRGTVLAYSTGDARAPLVKVATEGLIDEIYSHAFAHRGLAEAIGIDRQFARRHGVAAVRQRIDSLGGVSGTPGNYGELIRRRSVIRFGLEALSRQQEGDSSENLALRIQERQDGLAEVERALATWPIRKLMPFEVPQLIAFAFDTALHHVVVTSTMPTETRFSGVLAGLLKTALRRGVKISILLAGRPELNADTSQKRRWNPMGELNGLCETYRNLHVAFLKDVTRTVFEIKVDDSWLVVANEPFLGVRPKELLLRCFSGYLLQRQSQIQTYVANQMMGDKVAEVEQLRVRNHPVGRDRASTKTSSRRHRSNVKARV